jgi:predicted  nucleic acid-binding Zn-ribbon protein
MIITWYDLIPVFGVVVTIAGLSYNAGQIVQKQDHIIEDVKELQNDMREVKTDIRRNDAELKDLDKRVTVVETKIAGSNQKNV